MGICGREGDTDEGWGVSCMSEVPRRQRGGSRWKGRPLLGEGLTDL